MMRKTPLKRTSLRAKVADTLSVKVMAKCEVCDAEFEKRRMGHRVCKPACAAKVVKRDTAARKEALKSLTDWEREAQVDFNAFIRARDHKAGYPCISCQRFHTGKWNAGHYLSVGAHRNLRYNENNCHLQCEPCNTNLSGNIAKYRPNLIAKIGIEAVEALESDNAYHKFTVDELKAIKATYKAKLRELQK